MDHKGCELPNKGRQVMGTNGEQLWILQEMDEKHLEFQLSRIRQLGIASLAVVLMHSYM